MKDYSHTAVLVDYDEDLFAPPPGIGHELEQHNIAWIEAQCQTTEAALELAGGADVVLQQSLRPLLTRDTISRLERCRCIARLGIGYDNVDIEAATSHGILVCNAPTYCVDDVADHALALLIDAARHVALQARWIGNGKWDRTGARPARRMRGSTLGFVAFGRIARRLAEQVSGFGMTLLAYDPYVDAETMGQLGVEKVDLDDLLRRSDFISIHSPLTSQTHHLLSHREFDLMKPGVFIVNTSRGPLIDEEALVEGLRSSRVCGAGLDVVEHEPLPLDSPLRQFERVTFTPHVGANSEESRVELYRIGCQIAKDVCRGIYPQAVVNPQAEQHSSVRYVRT